MGNGPAPDIATKARHADAVIQINACAHREWIAPEKMSHVCVTNTSDPATIESIVSMLLSLDLPAHTRIVFSRNHTFYWLKAFVAWLGQAKTVQNFLPFKIDLARRSETISFLASCRLEYTMLSAGMAPGSMPSTGMVAYHWLSRKLRAGDSLDLAGFTFEGWDRHAWDVERKLLKGVYPPG